METSYYLIHRKTPYGHNCWRLIYYSLFRIIFLIIIVSSCAYSQNSSSCFVFNSPNAIFFGVDYSKVKCVNIGPTGFKDLPKIRDLYFNEINSIFIKEYPDNKISKFFKKPVEISLETARSRNVTANIQNIIQNDKQTMPNETIDSILTFYPTNNTNSELGILFIAENLVKLKEGKSDESYATFWVIFFKISDHNKLLSLHMTGACGGVGFRNFWWTSARNVLQAINMKKLKQEYCP